MDGLIRGSIEAFSGDGDGYGDGYGYGYGDGSGYGYGDGDGSGYGYGYGYGDGSGYGYGYGEYWLSVMAVAVAAWDQPQQNRLAALKASGARVAFWRSDDKGHACNGGKTKTVAVPGLIETSAGPLNLCERGTLHATLNPPKWHGARLWIVALTGEVIGDDDKYGALSREILGEVILKG